MRNEALRPALATLVALVVVACGAVAGSPQSIDKPTAIRLGYFPNLTHAAALVGVQGGAIAQALGTDYPLTTATFNAGPEAVQALLSNSIDATYIGPSPIVNAFVQSHGQAVRVIAGATSGGASLVVKPSVTSAADLRGKTLATPQLGNTQDVSLRYWLTTKGLKPSAQEKGDVTVQPMDNSAALQAFRQGQIDGAWVPEPWASRYVLEAGAKVLVDEASLWPNGTFATTVLAVRTDFLNAHPMAVTRLLEAQIKLTDQLTTSPATAQKAANAQLAALTGKGLSDQVEAAAWKNLRFTLDPMTSSITVQAQHANQVGLLAKVDLKGLVDVRLLNQVLEADGKPQVKAA